MKKELYFLRSSEQKIIKDMVHIAHNLTQEESLIYSDFFGFSDKDLGLYVLVNNKIAGAIWSRKLKQQDNASGFINEDTPVVSFAILPEFKGKEIGSFMMEQFLQEAGAVYAALSINISHKPKSLKFYEKFGFEKTENEFVLIKKLEKKEVIRPTDGYDPRRWMD